MTEDEDIDPEIQLSIFNGLAYAMASKYSAIYEVIDDKLVEFDDETRRKRKRGELCLRCGEQPSRDYNPEKRGWHDQGFCETCFQTLKEAGEYCEKCKYAFDKDVYMKTDILCKLCAECGDAPRMDF